MEDLLRPQVLEEAAAEELSSEQKLVAVPEGVPKAVKAAVAAAARAVCALAEAAAVRVKATAGRE